MPLRTFSRCSLFRAARHAGTSVIEKMLPGGSALGEPANRFDPSAGVPGRCRLPHNALPAVLLMTLIDVDALEPLPNAMFTFQTHIHNGPVVLMMFIVHLVDRLRANGPFLVPSSHPCRAWAPQHQALHPYGPHRTHQRRVCMKD